MTVPGFECPNAGSVDWQSLMPARPTPIQSTESGLTTVTADAGIGPLALAYSEASSRLSGYCFLSSSTIFEQGRFDFHGAKRKEDFGDWPQIAATLRGFGVPLAASLRQSGVVLGTSRRKNLDRRSISERWPSIFHMILSAH